MALEIRGFWQRNEGKNEARVLEFFSAARPHGIHGFWSREGQKNDAFDFGLGYQKRIYNSSSRALESIYIVLIWMEKSLQTVN